ncbi:hypothetical protein M404DRAFT_998641 [Pisolithus tinctorius Marx 270]|uniref:Uncharacterized protein n=1 Tax=Pisolithus tinctorius Marx 270 TaxID=870435 RepID=A0A0C3JDT0_PISTI|nr:hypothetical protein M404DRAFT_998641 [Pisolithus tinctorius Marx 270]
MTDSPPPSSSVEGETPRGVLATIPQLFSCRNSAVKLVLRIRQFLQLPGCTDELQPTPFNRITVRLSSCHGGH